MSSSNYRVRRATLDDVGPLTALWRSMQFPVEDLAKRVTEFQVAEGPDGKVVGAVGLQIAERQGRIHSEAYTDFALADQLRPMLWDRVHSVATNHGLLRLWTQEKAPFWNHSGLLKSDTERLQRLPALWRNLPPDWLTLKLKDELDSVISLDKEFAMFMESEKERTSKAFRQAKVLKAIAAIIVVIVFALVMVGAFFLIIRRNPAFLPH
jgi:N-acetylglutamate synthase-like GNAT family acetyltransferase